MNKLAIKADNARWRWTVAIMGAMIALFIISIAAGAAQGYL